MTKPLSEAQRKARQENARRMATLPRSPKQLEHTKSLGDIPKNHQTEKQLKSVRENQKKSYANLTDAQHKALEDGRKLGTPAVKEKQAWRKGLDVAHSPTMRQRAREWVISLRKSGLKETGIEKKVRQCLSELGIPFESEFTFDGIGTVDFFLPQYRLVVECDGEYWHNLDGVREKDATRDAKLQAEGLRVMRFTESQINKQIDSVRKAIQQATC